MSDPLNPIVPALVSSCVRRITKLGKPYWLAIVDVQVEEGSLRVPVVVGASKAQLAKGVTANELATLGLTLEQAVAAPEQAAGRTISVRYEEPSDANPNGSWRIATAASAPIDEFRAALAAQV